MKSSIEELRYKQSLPLDQKVEMSQCVIEQWWGRWEGKVYVSFSGGKDSTVLLHLVRSLFPNIPAVFSDTGLEYPELKDYVKSVSNIEIIRPKISYRQVIEKYGYPVVSKEQAKYIYELKRTKSEKLRDIRLNGNKWGQGKISKKWRFLLDAPFEVSHKCCDVLKKAPFYKYEKSTGNRPYLGIVAEESRMRTETYLRFGCNAFETKRPISTPIAFWTTQDILKYIQEFNLFIPSVYGEIIREDGKLINTGVRQTGCIWCLYGTHLEKPRNKIQMLKDTHPKIWKYCMEDLNFKEIMEYIGVPYE